MKRCPKVDMPLFLRVVRDRPELRVRTDEFAPFVWSTYVDVVIPAVIVLPGPGSSGEEARLCGEARSLLGAGRVGVGGA